MASRPPQVKGIEPWVNEIVSVITTDGRQFVGLLVIQDSSTNVVLQHCHERVYYQDKGVQKVDCQTMVIRGDSVLCVGKIDEDKDFDLNFDAIRGHPFPPMP